MNNYWIYYQSFLKKVSSVHLIFISYYKSLLHQLLSTPYCKLENHPYHPGVVQAQKYLMHHQHNTRPINTIRQRNKVRYSTSCITDNAWNAIRTPFIYKRRPFVELHVWTICDQTGDIDIDGPQIVNSTGIEYLSNYRSIGSDAHKRDAPTLTIRHTWYMNNST